MARLHMPPRKPIYVLADTARLFQVAPPSYLGPERRQAPRFDLRLPLKLTRKSFQRVSEHGETRNISSKGVLFQTQSRMRVGELVEYIVTLPAASRRSGKKVVRLHCSGRVARWVESEVAATLERYKFVR